MVFFVNVGVSLAKEIPNIEGNPVDYIHGQVLIMSEFVKPDLKTEHCCGT